MIEPASKGPTSDIEPFVRNFDQFYLENYRSVVALVYTLTGSRHGAEDIAQDAFLRAHRLWREVSGYERPDGWVRVVAMNLARLRFGELEPRPGRLLAWLGSHERLFRSSSRTTSASGKQCEIYLAANVKSWRSTISRIARWPTSPRSLELPRAPSRTPWPRDEEPSLGPWRWHCESRSNRQRRCS